MNKNAFSLSGPAPNLSNAVGNDMASPRIQGVHGPPDPGLTIPAEGCPRFEWDGSKIEAGWTCDWLVISEEIDLLPLLDKILRIVMRRTDAIKGSFLLWAGYEFLVAAKAMVAEKQDWVVHSEMMREKPHPPLSYISDHICKTRTPVLLNKPVQWLYLGIDPRGPEELPPSVLCWPFPHGPDLVGVLYLEKNQPDRPFGQMDLRYLAKLSPLISVSLKNANRVKAMESRIRDLEKTNAKLNEALAEQIRAFQTLRKKDLEERSQLMDL